MSFWDAFFLLLIYIPLVMLWVFAVADIFRREDIGGAAKAIWCAVVILLPYIGTIIYLLTRRPNRVPEEGEAIGAPPASTTSELATLADLHDRGKLTDDEFAAQKARLLGV